MCNLWVWFFRMGVSLRECLGSLSVCMSVCACERVYVCVCEREFMFMYVHGCFVSLLV